MSQENFELLSNLMYVYKIFLQIILFLFLWEIFYPMKIRESISQIWNTRDIKKNLFVILLFWNLHSLSFLVSNSIYQYLENEWMKNVFIETIADMTFVYQNTTIGMIVMFLSYTILFSAMILGIKKIVIKSYPMNWIEFIFLSVLNIVGWMFAQMVSKIMIVKMDMEVFMLFDKKTELLWWIPFMAVLLYIGEIAVLYSYQKYTENKLEREKNFVEQQQLKIMKQRLEDVENFYGNIRKVRHEMKNHMTNIKGLVASQQYKEVEGYIHKLDDSIQELEYKYATGNVVTDVIINDTWRQAEKLGISFEVDFSFMGNISVYDMAIVLNNLLSNAIDACEKVEPEKRFIHLTLKRKKRFLLLEVENSFQGSLKWEVGAALPATTKQKDLPDDLMEHGIGLKNVRDVAERYFGDLDIKVEKDIFKITVMLQLKEEEYHANYNTND